MTREEYEELFSIAREKFSHIIKGEEGDISAFHAHCGKLLLSHCAFDELIFPGGTVDVYRRMINSLGGEDKSLDTLRFFLTPGGSHCGHYALGITLADGMIALMNWVEKGIAPESMPLEMKDVRFNSAPTVRRQLVACTSCPSIPILSSQTTPFLTYNVLHRYILTNNRPGFPLWEARLLCCVNDVTTHF